MHTFICVHIYIILVPLAGYAAWIHICNVLVPMGANIAWIHLRIILVPMDAYIAWNHLCIFLVPMDACVTCVHLCIILVPMDAHTTMDTYVDSSFGMSAMPPILQSTFSSRFCSEVHESHLCHWHRNQTLPGQVSYVCLSSRQRSSTLRRRAGAGKLNFY